MRLKFLKAAATLGQIRQAGSVHEISDEKHAAHLIKRGFAQETKEPVTPPEPQQSGGPA